MSLYFNGALVASTTATNRPFGELTGANPGIGIANTEDSNFSQYFDGVIDEVRISDVALQPNQFLTSPPLLTASLNPTGALNLAWPNVTTSNYWQVEGAPLFGNWSVLTSQTNFPPVAVATGDVPYEFFRLVSTNK